MLHVMKRVVGAIAALSLAACSQESSPFSEAIRSRMRSRRT